MDLGVFKNMKKLKANHPFDWQLLNFFYYLDFSLVNLNDIKVKLDNDNLTLKNLLKFVRLHKFDPLLFNKACYILAAYKAFGQQLIPGNNVLDFEQWKNI